MTGALGGFALPIWFGALNDLTNLWTSCYMLLFALVGVALGWMHATVTIMNRRAIAAIRGLQDLPELPELQQGRSGTGRVTLGISRAAERSAEHPSEIQSLIRLSFAGLSLKN